jgi:hypothetical protein
MYMYFHPDGIPANEKKSRRAGIKIQNTPSPVAAAANNGLKLHTTRGAKIKRDFVSIGESKKSWPVSYVLICKGLARYYVSLRRKLFSARVYFQPEQRVFVVLLNYQSACSPPPRRGFFLTGAFCLSFCVYRRRRERNI